MLSPPTPPDKRVRIRRFDKLTSLEQHRGRRLEELPVDGGFAARRVPLQASPAPNSLKLSPKADWLAHGRA